MDAGVANAIVSETAESAVCWLSGQAGYCYNFNSYIKDFRDAKDQLEAATKNLQDQVRKAEQNLEKTGDHVTERLKKACVLVQDAKTFDQKVQKKRSCLGGCPNLICRYFLSRKAEGMKLLMEGCNEKFEPMKQLKRRETFTYVDTPGNFFYSKSAQRAYQELREALENEAVNRIGLYGMAGCGKTTLLEKLRNEVQNSNPFDKVAHVDMSENPLIKDIQGKIASHLNLEFETGAGELERANRLLSRLRFKERVLIILDHVWQSLEFKHIGIPTDKSDSNYKNCTVVIATRRQQVCRVMDCQKEIKLELLDEVDAWDLFKMHAEILNEDPDSSKLTQAEEICKKCGGLPTAIVGMAISLKGKPPCDWDEAVDNLIYYKQLSIEKGVEDPYKRLVSSYDNIKDDTIAKGLFLLCSLFLEVSEIQVEYLIRSGIGLDMFGKFATYKMARRKADSTINNLIRSSMLLRGKSGDDVQTVIMHDVFRSLVLNIEKREIKLFMGPEINLMALADESSMRYLYCHNIGDFTSHLEFPKLEILFISEDGECSPKVPDTFFGGMTGLKVLVITSNHMFLELSKWLINLRTLRLKGCILDTAFSLGNLMQLETLEFCQCEIERFCIEIEQLKKLKLLDVSRCRIGGNPCKVLGGCSHLEELYFLKNNLSAVKPIYRSLADFLKKEQSSFQNLKRYHVQIGSSVDNMMEKGDLRPRILSIDHFEASTSNATVKDLVQRAEILFLKKVHGGCRNIIPGTFETGGMNELIELLLCESHGIECVIDVTNNICESGTVFSKLKKLRIQNMKSLIVLCHGRSPPGLFERLEELRISECNQMTGILFEGELNLHTLKVLELHECQSLTSLFSPVVAQNLKVLQVLKIINCIELKRIIACEESGIVSDDIVVFPKLQVLSVVECHQLEYIIPVSLAMGLEQLKVLTIYQAGMLKYVFGQSESNSSNQNLSEHGEIEVRALNQLELVDLENIISICSGNHNLSWPSGLKPHFERCPGLTRSTAPVNGSNSEARQQADQNPTNRPTSSSFDTPVVRAETEVRQQADYNPTNQLTSISVDTPVVRSESEVIDRRDHNPTNQVNANIGITTRVKDLMCGTVRQASCCCCCCCKGSSTEESQMGIERLELEIEDLQNRVEAARENCEIIAPDVQKLLDGARYLLKQWRELEESKRQKRSLDWGGQYRPGKQMEKEIKAVMELIENIKFNQVICPLPVIVSESFIYFNTTKSAYYELLKALKDDEISMIALYGLGGCGKTTLVMEVAKEAERSLLFDKVVFVVVSMIVDVKRIQGEIASALNMELKEEDESERAERLSLRLTLQRTLIILDDVPQRLNLENIGIPSGGVQERCCVLLTSRSLNVCKLMDSQRTIPLSPLTEDDAWFMFQKNAGITDDTPVTMKAVALEISHECEGLPVEITTVASALKGKRLLEWLDALRSLKRSNKSSLIDVEEGLRDSYRCLIRSYDNLQSEQAKSLFLLCSIFPKGQEIPMEILTRYAIGLGLFGEVETYEETRKQVHGAINKLIGSSLLMKVHEKGYVKMHDLVCDVALWMSKGQFRVVMESEWIQEELNSEIRYLWCDRVNELTDPLESGELELLCVHTYLVKEEFLLATKILRVLALKNPISSKNSILRLARSVEWLKSLCCLFLYGWELGNLPFIGSLVMLESLTFQHCSFDELPNEILQLTKLRLLELSECIIEKEPYQLIGRCSQLEEFYFTRCHNSKWELQANKSAELFGENSKLSLERYHIEVGKTSGWFSRVDPSVSRCLSIQNFDASTSNATINDLIKRAEVLFLKEVTGGCKNIIPGILQTKGGMNELVEIMLCDSAEIECLVDSTSALLSADVFSKLLKLTIETMESMEFLCRGPPPCNLFAELEELRMKRCYQMQGISSAGNPNLCSLKVLELHDCPMLISLFTPAVAQTLVRLEVLKVTACQGLKCIVADEEEEKDEIERLKQNSYGLEFSKLKEIVIQNCEGLEYVFGQNHEDQSSYQNGKKGIRIIELPLLDQLKLEQLPNMVGIFSANYCVNCPILCDVSLSDCPHLDVAAINNWGVGTEPPQDYTELRQQDHTVAQDFTELRQKDHNTTKVNADIGITSMIKDLMYRTICQTRYSLTEDLLMENEKLIETIKDICYRVDAENNKEIAPSVQNWLKEAWNLVEEVKELKEEAKKRRNIANSIRRSRLRKQMEKKRKAVIEQCEKGRFQELTRRVPLPGVAYRTSESFMDFSGRNVAHEEILEALKDDKISMIGLYGMGGCGKTTLAIEVGKAAEQALIFDRVIFVVVSRSIEIKKIQEKVASSLELRLDENEEFERAKRLFLRLTNGQRILIILDDVWRRLDFEAIGIPFGKLHNRCCVLITTRSLSVCRLMDCQKTILLSLLTEEEAWILFQNRAHITDESSDTLKVLAREISFACQGLPIAIAAVASTLKGKPLSEWKVALGRLKMSRPSEIEEGLLDPYECLSLSYDYLKSKEAKELFLLCSLFPKDYEIPLEILTRYAIALGLFGRTDSFQFKRKQMRVAINKLIDCCLLLEVPGEECVVMHDLVRDVALRIAKSEHEVDMRSEGTEEELLIGQEKYLWWDEMNELPDLSNFGELEFLYVHTDLVRDEYLLATKKLRVLVLNNRHAEKISLRWLSKSADWLKDLSCLSLYGWKLDNLSFIGSFERLESLTFQHCSFDELPTDILQLTRLKLLDLSDCKIEREPYEVIGRCSQLEELYFTRCHNSKWKLQGDNSAELIHKYGNLRLMRYHIEVGESFGLFDRVDDSISRGLSVQYFDATTNDLIQKAEVLFLKGVTGGCKNIVPDIFQTGVADEVIQLLVCNSAKIECLIDTTNALPGATIFSKLLKLTVESMEHMEFICRGHPPLDLFARLEELRMKSCYQMCSISSEGELNLSHLKVLELHDCPMLISLFTPSIAQSLVLLEVLKVTQCSGLKCIVADEEENDEIVCFQENSHGLKFKQLKQIVIQNCQHLEYVFGQKEAFKVIELPVLNQLRLEELPNMVLIFPENCNINLPALHDFNLLDCPKLIIGAINNCTVGTELRRQGNAITKDAIFIEKLGSLVVKNTHVEGIFCLDELATYGEPVTSGLTLLDLYLLPELRYICKGPKYFLSLQNLEELQIEGCGNLKFAFSTSIMRSLSNLKTLKIINCQELIQITEEDVNNQDQLSNHGFRDVCFPKLIILFIRDCNKLKRVYSVFTSHEFLKLKSLIIMGAFGLEEVFGQEKVDEYEDVELVLPNLEHLILRELPCLAHVFQGIQLKNADYRVVHDCPKLKLTSNISFEHLCQKVKEEEDKSVDRGDGLHGKLFKLLQTIEFNKSYTPAITSHQQMDPNDQDSVEASLESGYNQNDSGIGRIASPNLTENIEQTMKEAIGNVTSLEIPVVETSSTNSELKPSLSNTKIVEQSVQDLKNPSPAPFIIPVQEEFAQRLKGTTQESPRSKEAKMETFASHDSKSRSLTQEISDTSLHETSTKPMAMIAGAIVGVGELLNAVLLTKKRAVMLKPTLQRLEDTLRSIEPVIEQIQQYNRQLDRSKEETENLVKDMEVGRKLVLKCSEIQWWKSCFRPHYRQKLEELDNAILNFFEVRMEMRLLNRKERRGPCSAPEAPLFTVGLDVPLRDLKLKLLQFGVSVTVVTGSGGSGKTTLAKMLCQDEDVKEKFKDNIFFVTFSKTPNLNTILQNLCQHTNYKVPQLQSDEDTINQLGNLLKAIGESPILFVLDDVWSDSESIVENFLLTMPDYKILVTSRFQIRRFGDPYFLKPLNDKDAEELFRHSALLNSSSDIPNDIVTEIIRSCSGSPLAIKMNGRSLCRKETVVWQNRARELSSGHSVLDSTFDLLACLQKSFDALDTKAKECFMDLGLFPEDQRIAAAALVDMWTELQDEDDLSAMVKIYELAEGNMADIVVRRKFEGGLDNNIYHVVTQNNLLRKLAIRQSSQEPETQRNRLIIGINGNNLPSWWSPKEGYPVAARILSISTDEGFASEWCNMQPVNVEALILNLQSTKYTLPTFMDKMSKLKVLIITNYGFYRADLDNFELLGSLSNLKRIRLQSVSFPSLGKTRLQLKNLKKLSLFLCNMNEHFESCTEISDMLPNLVEINIDYCNLVILPSQFCKIVCLKKLSITNCHNLSALPEDIGELVNLELLWLSSCTEIEVLPESVRNLHKLKYLDISDCINLVKLPDYIGELCNLEKLNMRGCSRLSDLPLSVKELHRLKEVLCDKETVALWEDFQAILTGLRIKVVKPDISLNWLL